MKGGKWGRKERRIIEVRFHLDSGHINVGSLKNYQDKVRCGDTCLLSLILRTLKQEDCNFETNLWNIEKLSQAHGCTHVYILYTYTHWECNSGVPGDTKSKNQDQILNRNKLKALGCHVCIGSICCILHVQTLVHKLIDTENNLYFVLPFFHINHELHFIGKMLIKNYQYPNRIFKHIILSMYPQS